MSIRTTTRLPEPLHAALTKLAEANHRSINAEVVMAIEAHVDGANCCEPPSDASAELREAYRVASTGRRVS
jgi:predicted transcriptional regulator